MAVNHTTKEVLLALKGTNTLGDILTDVLGKAIPHKLERNTTNGSNSKQDDIRCHEGMYTAACLMLDDTLHILQNWIVPCGYSLTICGHSLGAGVSCLLGVMIKNLLPNLSLKVYAYATPSCLSLDACINCQDYITSIVNNNDIVPRISLLNVRTMNKFFNLIDSKLEEKGLSPNDFTTAYTYMQDLMTIDSDLLITPEEIYEFLQYELVDNAIFKPGETKCTNPKLLDCEIFVPGRVVSIWNNYNHDNNETSKDDSGSSGGKDSPQEQARVQIPNVGGRVLDGTMHVLRTIFLEIDMISDHNINAYRTNLLNLLQQQQQQQQQ